MRLVKKNIVRVNYCKDYGSQQHKNEIIKFYCDIKLVALPPLPSAVHPRSVFDYPFICYLGYTKVLASKSFKICHLFFVLGSIMNRTSIFCLFSNRICVRNYNKCCRKRFNFF